MAKAYLEVDEVKKLEDTASPVVSSIYQWWISLSAA
jgi:hypothetical protein